MLAIKFETSSYSPIKCLLIVHAVLPIELVNTSARLGSLLLASVERMALGTDLNVDILLRGACYKGIPAVAGHRCLIILWMDSFSHVFHLAYYIKSYRDFSYFVLFPLQTAYSL